MKTSIIDEKRLSKLFSELVRIDSISRNESELCKKIKVKLETLREEVILDRSGPATGSNTGNLICKIPGTVDKPPLLINAHMDTVTTGIAVDVDLKNGLFTSRGDTILGADDKSAIAIILECVQCVTENGLAHGPLDLVFTVCEEIGLLGAKHLDYSLIDARYGYALDAGDTDAIITRTPSANQVEIKVHGIEAHAGACPEKGLNAISLACKAIASLDIGRIDHETTCNIGIIEGGVATNIVPNLVTIKGEVRSHSEEKLQTVSERIVNGFNSVINDYLGNSPEMNQAKIETMIDREYTKMVIPEHHHVIRLADRAAHRLGRELRLKTIGGGSDANIFFENGINCAILGTGMKNVHTSKENISLQDMVRSAELLLEIIHIHAK